MKILEEVDRRNHHGDIGALLRREGLYSSQLTAWRRARSQGELAARAALVQRRGPKPKPAVDPAVKQAAKRVADLELLIGAEAPSPSVLSQPSLPPELAPATRRHEGKVSVFHTTEKSDFA